MTAQGSPYTRFDRALKSGNLNLIRAAAAKLPQLRLPHALRICQAMTGEPALYERAAARWIGRFCLEAKSARLEDVEEATIALRSLPEAEAESLAMLTGLCERHGLR